MKKIKLSLTDKITIIFACAFFALCFFVYKTKDNEKFKIDNAVVKKEEVKAHTINLKKVGFKDLQGFDNENFIEVLPVLIKSCEKIVQSQNDRIVKKIYHDQACKALMNISDKSNENIKKVIEKYFEPHLVLNEDKKSFDGTFTGYYSAELHGSYEKDDVYKYPLYKLPDDLITVDMSMFTNCTRCTYVARYDEENKKLVPYFSKSDIENGKMEKAEVLLWVDNPVDALILHIQGSGVVILPDGNEVKVNYAGNNGHAFIGIGAILKSFDLLEKGKGSMQDVKEWLNNNKEEAEKLMNINPRYIFFRQAVNNEGPIGSLGVELTEKRSLAVDNNYIPLGTFIWLDTVSPDGDKIQNLMSAQDTGIAIKGRIRGDFYFGHGEKAFKDAGRMKSKGFYYLILPKEKLIKE